MTAGVDVWRTGLITWTWTARAVITRPMRTASLIIYPTGHRVLVGEGFAFTRWGAERRARRAIRYAP